MKKILIVTAAILTLGLAAAGGFWGGIQYQVNQAEQAQTEFFNARGQAPGGQFQDQAPGFQMGGQPDGQSPAGFRGGTIGVIKTIEGNVITISTAQDVTTVTLTDTSQINRTETVPVSELETGMRISVMGKQDSEGILEASVITILNTDPADNSNPSGMEP